MEQRKIILPLPVSDNRRLIIRHNRRGECLHRLVLSPEARDYMRDAMLLVKGQWPRGDILVPSNTHQLHITAKAYVKNWRGDCSNFTKLLKDVLSGTVYDDDKFVHLNYLDSEKDAINPRIECTIPVDLFSVATRNNTGEKERKIEKLRPSGCTCAYPHLLFLGWEENGITHHPKCPTNKTNQ